MEPARQAVTCAICFEEISIEQEVGLDSCKHKYCDPCITKWVKEFANSCPYCKQKVTKIIGKDSLGRPVERPVEDR